MCVWSAYAGKKEAAPLLLEALKKTEGYWAGFYTGIAVCSGNNKINFAKCAGHTGVWEERFNVADLPGNTGIAHSRTNSGGDDKFAHPYVGTEGIVALVSQGSVGIFGDEKPRYAEVGRRLFDQGRRMRSASTPSVTRPNPLFVMPDGKQLALSDIVVNEIESEYMKHGDMVKAMRAASGYMLEESSSMCIFADKPGVIGFINMNQRVGYSFEDDGVYMGITQAGFPGSFTEIPGNSVGYVTADGVIHREALGDFKVNNTIPEKIAPAIIEVLRAEPGLLMGQICDKAVRPSGFDSSELNYHALAAYRALESLIAAGTVRYEVVDTVGGTGVPGRTFRWYLNEEKC